MTATNVRVQMQQRRDTAANWTAAGPTLLAGEIGYETDTGKIKIGDGVTAWASLAYLPIPNSTGELDDDLTITGDLTVQGTTTTIESTTLTIEDKNIELAVVDTPTDVTADGGGITLKGATDKTINWIDSTDAWTFSEHINIASTKEYRINGTKVLDATSLGSAVVSSSLTSVGTITSGTWQGTAIDAAYLDSTVVTTGDTGTVTSTMIADGTIANADVSASAAIAGSKIDPDFGSQTIETTGDLAINTDTLFVDASGNAVGIGTTSPSELLHCVVTGDADAALFERGDASGVVRIQLQSGDGSSAALRVNDGGDNLGFYVPATSATADVTIDSSGRLLVGTVSSPAYQLQLETDSAGKPSTNTWTIVSDERIKEEIELADLDLCYEAVKNIPLKRFKWKDEVYTEEQAYDRRKLGWIAQDVEAVFPKAVRQHEFKYNQVFEEVVIPAAPAELDDDGNIITEEQPERIEKGKLISEEVIEDCRDLNSDQLYAAMYGAIQKLISKVELLEAEVQALKAA